VTSGPEQIAKRLGEGGSSIWAALTDQASLRTWTSIANDGIIATAAILEGFVGAGATDRALLIAATVATIAGVITAGGVEWAQADAEREAQLQVAAEEAASLAVRPETELEELVSHYERRGLSPELARTVAEQLNARDALAAQLESEHGITQVITRTDAIVTGVGAAFAYLMGAAIPLLITVFVPGALEAWAIIAAVAASLILTSVVGARTGHMTLGRTVTRSLVVGLGTLLISYTLGKIFF